MQTRQRELSALFLRVFRKHALRNQDISRFVFKFRSSHAYSRARARVYGYGCVRARILRNVTCRCVNVSTRHVDEKYCNCVFRRYDRFPISFYQRYEPSKNNPRVCMCVCVRVSPVYFRYFILRLKLYAKISRVCNYILIFSASCIYPFSGISI